MKALCWHGTNDVRVDNVPDPKLLNPRDAIIEVTRTAICGSDLHLVNGFFPTMKEGDILGHEFMGRIVDKGVGVKNLNIGDRVVVPFTIACGTCSFCARGQTSFCDNSNPNAWMADTFCGHGGSGLFGYSHLTGGYSGGQAQYVRVPFADVGALVVPENLDDEQVLFLSDILPTGYMAAENCRIQKGDIVAVWGCGPVGLLTMLSARLLGAERIIAIDRFPERLEKAKTFCSAETINYSDAGVVELINQMTGGRGPDACIDAVGMEAHAHGIQGVYDNVKQHLRLQTDRSSALREAIYVCRKGGVVSIPGVYSGLLDKFPLGIAFNKGLEFKMGQTHVHRYMKPLLDLIARGDIDPSFVISHRMALSDAPKAYEIFKHKQDQCVKVVLDPAA